MELGAKKELPRATAKSLSTKEGTSSITGDTPRLVGLMVFLGGIAMIVMVFVWAYALYSSVGDELNQVAISQATPTTNPADSDSDQPPNAPAEQVIVATPRSGTSLAQVATVFALKLVFLALMGWAGGLVATKGVAMTRQIH